MSRNYRGTTLMELSVTMFLTALMLLCVQQILAAAARYYNSATIAMEIQQSLLVSLTRISAEMSEGSYFSTQVDEGPPAGVMFWTVRKANGTVELAPNGKAYWQRMVCYYTETVNGVPCLVTKYRDGIGQFTEAPVVDAPWDKIATWQAATNLKTKVVARHISEFKVTNTQPIFLEMTGADPSGRYLIKIDSNVSPRN